jgi:hypothetical protein
MEKIKKKKMNEAYEKTRRRTEVEEERRMK